MGGVVVEIHVSVVEALHGVDLLGLLCRSQHCGHFVVVIIAFNIYSSLRMLVIEKEDDIATLRSLGATDGLVRHIFRLEGWLVSLLGMAVGLVLGIALVLAQQKFGLVPMPGNFVVDTYPVVLRAADLLWTVAGVALIGYLMDLLPTRKI